MKSQFFKLKIGVAPLVLGAALISAPAFAQDTAADDGASSEDTIVVTGSRISRPDLEGSTPVAVLGEAQLDQQGLKNFADIAAQNPQFAPSFGASRTQSTFSGSASSGLNLVNLRNLGANRSLVLINGRRVPGGSPTDTFVDFNTMTTANIEQVQVLTGGASAIYGSDAVAGVINIITKKGFEGLEAGASYGISQRGDNKNPSAYLMFGSKLNDRGHILVTAEYDYQGFVGCSSRYLCAQDFAWTNPETGPIRGPNAYSGVPLGGRFFAGSSGSFTNRNGDFVQFSVPIDGYNRNARRTLAIPTERMMFSAEAEYAVSDSVNVFMEASYGRSTTTGLFEAAPFSSDTNLFGGVLPPTIPYDNPFLPEAVKNAYTPAQIANGINWSQRFQDLGERGSTNERQTVRLVAGLNGDFELLKDRNWHWEVSYVYGRTSLNSKTEGLVGTDRLYYGLRVEADPANPGGYRCTDAGARAAGCVAINPFAPYTQEMKDYLVVSAGQQGRSILHDANAYISGELFDLPGGPVSVALGAEYRTFSGFLDYDDAIEGGLTTGNQIGDVDFVKSTTKEAYVEAILPVLSDMAFAKSLTLEGAFRISDPNRGKNYETWKYGGTWEPIEGVRFRAIRARAVRAPVPSDLSGIGQTFGVVNDPCTAARRNANATRAANCAADGIPANYNPPLTVEQGVQGFVGGNPDLEPEKATTLTYGIALTPRFLPGFSLTVDRFDIKIKDLISTVGRQEQADLCYDTTDRLFCDQLTRGVDDEVPGANYVLKAVNDQLLNVATLRVKGIDVDARYAFNLGGGRINLQGQATIYDKASKIAIPGQDPIKYDGTIGGSTSDQGWPTWQGTLNFNYKLDDFAFNYHFRYIPKTEAAVGTKDAGFPDVPAQSYSDIRLSYNVDKQYEFYFGVNNLFDNSPPFFPTGTSGTQALDTIPAYYDVFGRSFYAGIKANF